MPSSIERNSSLRALLYRSGKFIKAQKYELNKRLKGKKERFRAFIGNAVVKNPLVLTANLSNLPKRQDRDQCVILIKLSSAHETTAPQHNITVFLFGFILSGGICRVFKISHPIQVRADDRRCDRPEGTL